MKINLGIISFACFFVVLVFGAFWFSSTIVEMGNDRIVMNCISKIDLSSELQRDFCLNIMEGVGWDKKEDSRGNLYNTIKELDALSGKTEVEE